MGALLVAEWLEPQQEEWKPQAADWAWPQARGPKVWVLPGPGLPVHWPKEPQAAECFPRVWAPEQVAERPWRAWAR